jgi:hypothetical protein
MTSQLIDEFNALLLRRLRNMKSPTAIEASDSLLGLLKIKILFTCQQKGDSIYSTSASESVKQIRYDVSLINSQTKLYICVRPSV